MHRIFLIFKSKNDLLLLGLRLTWLALFLLLNLRLSRLVFILLRFFTLIRQCYSRTFLSRLERLLHFLYLTQIIRFWVLINVIFDATSNTASAWWYCCSGIVIVNLRITLIILIFFISENSLRPVCSIFIDDLSFLCLLGSWILRKHR